MNFTQWRAHKRATKNLKEAESRVARVIREADSNTYGKCIAEFPDANHELWIYLGSHVKVDRDLCLKDLRTHNRQTIMLDNRIDVRMTLETRIALAKCLNDFADQAEHKLNEEVNLIATLLKEKK